MPQPSTHSANGLGFGLVHGAAAGLATLGLEVVLRDRRPAGLRPWAEALLAGAVAAVASLDRVPRARPAPAPPDEPSASRPSFRHARGGAHPDPTARQPHGAVRKLYAGAAALSFSVVADSAMEHYRGGFYNPVMYAGPTVAALALAGALRGLRRPRGGRGRAGVFAAAAATGLVGTAFHGYNIGRKEGGFSWHNLFYAAPLAAPFGVTAAGLFGLAAGRIARRRRGGAVPRLAGLRAGPLLAGGAALGLLGTAAEAGLLHFRGAFHDPFMYIPVVIPPLAAVATGAALLRFTPARAATARALLWSTTTAGLIGMGFHAYGVQRNMGGWRNWSQNLLQGPPLPAPPSFTGMALAGLAALELMQGGARA